MTQYPSKKTLQKFIKDQTGLDVEHVDENPKICSEVFLSSFGFAGSLVIYEDDQGILRAAPVPFGLAVRTAA